MASHGICTMYTLPWDASHGILHCNMPWDSITWHITMYTLPWDASHGICTMYISMRCHHMAGYYNVHMPCDAITWQGVQCTYAMRWHHMAYVQCTYAMRCHHMAYYNVHMPWDASHGILQCTYAMRCITWQGVQCNMPCVPSQEAVIVICHVCHHMAYVQCTACHEMAITWHITMTPSWDGTHGILHCNTLHEMASQEAYYNMLLRWHHMAYVQCTPCHEMHHMAYVQCTYAMRCTHGILQ